MSSFYRNWENARKASIMAQDAMDYVNALSLGLPIREAAQQKEVARNILPSLRQAEKALEEFQEYLKLWGVQLEEFISQEEEVGEESTDH